MFLLHYVAVGITYMSRYHVWVANAAVFVTRLFSFLLSAAHTSPNAQTSFRENYGNLKILSDNK